MINYKPIVFKKDRRKGPDFVVQMLRASNIIAWSLFFAVITITQKARPETETMFERGFRISIRDSWDRSLMDKAFILMMFLFLFSIFSIIINRIRLRRKTDNIRLSFIISAGTSFIGILLYIIFPCRLNS